jgi:hypothetical protein
VEKNNKIEQLAALQKYKKILGNPDECFQLVESGN